MDVAAGAQERAVRTGVLLHAAPAADAQELERAADQQCHVANSANIVSGTYGIARFHCRGNPLRTLAGAVYRMSFVLVVVVRVLRAEF